MANDNEGNLTELEQAVNNKDWKKASLLIGLKVGRMDHCKNVAYHMIISENADLCKSCVEMIDKFDSTAKMKLLRGSIRRNNNKDTLLHLAVRCGVLENFKPLLIYCDLQLKNKEGKTPLHLAAEMKCDVDRVTNKSDSLKTLLGSGEWNKAGGENSSAETNEENGGTDTARSSNRVDTNKPLTSEPTNEAYINMRNKKGDSALDICASLGDSDSVLLLLEHNAELQPSVLKKLVDQCRKQILNQEKMKSLKGVYDTIVSHVKYDRSRNNGTGNEKVTLTIDGNDVQLNINIGMRDLLERKDIKYKDKGLGKQTSQFEEDTLSVVQYACALGSVEMLKWLLQTPDVYKFASSSDSSYKVYDVTDLVPDTIANRSNENEDIESCAEIIVRQRDSRRRWKMLDIEPLRQVTVNFWKVGEVFAYVLVAAHILYMTMFTSINIPTIGWLKNRANNTSPETSTQNVGWIIWPLALLIIHSLQVFVGFIRINPRHNTVSVLAKGDAEPQESGRTSFVEQLPNLLLELFTRLWVLLFLVLTVTWYCAYKLILHVSYQRYLEILAATLIVGWLQTLKYFKFISSFSVTMSRFWRIVFRDILSIFLVVYFLILVAFGCALHVLNMTTLDNDTYTNTSLSLYVAFISSLGIGNGLYDLSKDGDYFNNEGNVDLIRIVFSIYLCLTTVILLNILIAMMNNTYKQAWMTSSTKKMLSSIQISFWLHKKLKQNTSSTICSKNLASLGKMILGFNRIPDIQNVDGRYYMWIAKSKANDKSRIDINQEYMNEIKTQIIDDVKKCFEEKLKDFLHHHETVNSKKLPSKDGQKAEMELLQEIKINKNLLMELQPSLNKLLESYNLDKLGNNSAGSVELKSKVDDLEDTRRSTHLKSRAETEEDSELKMELLELIKMMKSEINGLKIITDEVESTVKEWIEIKPKLTELAELKINVNDLAKLKVEVRSLAKLKPEVKELADLRFEVSKLINKIDEASNKTTFSKAPEKSKHRRLSDPDRLHIDSIVPVIMIPHPDT